MAIDLSLNLQKPDLSPRALFGTQGTTWSQYSNSTLKDSNNSNNALRTAGANLASGVLGQGIDFFAQNAFGDSDAGQVMGNLFSTGLSSISDTVLNNFSKGTGLLQGMGKNLSGSLTGAAIGIGANYLGKGISAAMGNSSAGKALGAGVASGVGSLGGRAATNLLNGTKIFSGLSNFNSIGGIVGSAVGAALSAGTGPSKEYKGKYGNITQGLDTAYDLASTAVGFVPGVGQAISGMMALNKGLSNVFGSTSGMTKQDAILGSAFMPFFVKWLNMAGAKKTNTFKNQSWQNTQKTNSFMGNAFGNLGDRLDKAREEAGKTYGTFSRSAYNKAENNINFANTAWDKLLAMADQDEIQNIRSQYMSSINNQRYAQNIQGGWSPLARGKQGMKILNNATNHNIGQRLLSGAALIDNKQMILCSAVD